jgi:hypothetical protein
LFNSLWGPNIAQAAMEKQDSLELESEWSLYLTWYFLIKCRFSLVHIKCPEYICGPSYQNHTCTYIADSLENHVLSFSTMQIILNFELLGTFIWTNLNLHILMMLHIKYYSIAIANSLDKACQLLTQGRCFSPGTPTSSTTETGRHDIADILGSNERKMRKFYEIKRYNTWSL